MGIPTIDADSTQVLALLSAMGASTASARVVTISGEPRSKARPRFTRNGHVYSSEKQRAHHVAMGLCLSQEFRELLLGNVAVACLFVRSTKGRVDIDNMMKQVLDVANKICWQDDYQVTGLAALSAMDSENPRTVLAFAAHSSTLDRSDPTLHGICAGCGVEFTYRQYASQKPKKYCEGNCAARINKEHLKSPVTCMACHGVFVRKYAAQKLCSTACQVASLTASGWSRRKHPDGACSMCGVKTSRPEYVRCRACWGKSSKPTPGAKLDVAKATAIRSRYAEGGISHKALAAMYGVATSQISAVLSNQTWVDPQ